MILYSRSSFCSVDETFPTIHKFRLSLLLLGCGTIVSSTIKFLLDAKYCIEGNVTQVNGKT